MTVTAIICTYQRPLYLSESLDSVLNQTRKADEILVIFDGGDYDSFTDFTSRYRGVRFIYQENQGRSIAANRAVYEATSEYVAFLDDDDIWYPSKIEVMLSEMERVKCKAANHFFDAITIDGHTLSTDCTHMLKRNDECPCLVVRNPCAYSTTIVTRELYLLCGGMAPFQNHADDWTFYMNISRLETWPTVRVVLGSYRIHGAQGSSNYDAGLRILAQIFAYYYGGRPSRSLKSDVSFAETDTEVIRFASAACWSAFRIWNLRRLCQTIGIYLAFSGSWFSVFRLCLYIPPVVKLRHRFKRK